MGLKYLHFVWFIWFFQVQEQLNGWGAQFQRRPVEVSGRKLALENILFGNGVYQEQSSSKIADWTSEFRSK